MLDQGPSLSRRRLTQALLGASALGALLPASVRAASPAMPVKPPSGAPYRDPRLPAQARVEDLMARMSLEEKVAQMQCIWQDKAKVQTPAGDFDAALAGARYPDGIGMVARPSDIQRLSAPGAAAAESGVPVNRNAPETARYVNQAQRWAVEQTRLGIPCLTHEEALHGYVARDATSFPQAIALASSFDPEMVRQVFSVASREMRARGPVQALAPVVDVARDPRWGRIEETYGEDPYLCGQIGKAAVLGLQGESLPLAPDKVYATLKHMTGHGQPENGTNVGPAEISERTLREDFLPPFETIIRDTHVGSVMPSYNEVDGIPSHANRWLLRKVLREDFGFQGTTTSDYFAIRELITRHHIAADTVHAALFAIDAGVDVETADPTCYPNLVDLVRSRRVPEALIDEAVRRILTLKFDAGLFEHPYTDEARADALTATPDAIALARLAGTRSAVLLKNEGGLLPLDPKKVGRMLVLGHHASDTPIGGYSDVPRHVVSVLDGIRAEGQAWGFPVDYREGVRITEDRIWDKNEIVFTPPEVNVRLIAEAVAAARSADTIIMVLGGNEKTSREAWADNHLGDRQSLDLIGQQNDLARQILALNKPTVVLLLNGRPLSIVELAESAPAILEGWYMGQETGHAAADLIFGRANPGGKLPVSIARNVGQLPIFYNYKPTARRGYIDGTTKPLFPFGHGLSYTRFEISAPRPARTTIRPDETVRVEVDVRNVGDRPGDEVVQFYIRDDVSSVTRPVLELKGFRRVTLRPGESRTVSFELGPEQLRFYNADMVRVVEPGDFTLFSGPSSAELKSTTLTVA
jgi:beta-glucosidase